MAKRKQGEVPDEVEQVPLDFKVRTSLRTPKLVLFAQALNVSPEFLLQHCCSCLNQDVMGSAYDHLWENDQSYLVSWFQESFAHIEREEPLLPPTDELLRIVPNLTSQRFTEMRALVFLKYRDLQVCLSFLDVYPFWPLFFEFV